MSKYLTVSPSADLHFCRPVGMQARFVQDGIGRYYCLTQDAFDDLRIKAGIISSDEIGPATVLQIHPLDFAEMILEQAESDIAAYEKVGDETYKFAGRHFHWNKQTPRTSGDHVLV